MHNGRTHQSEAFFLNNNEKVFENVILFGRQLHIVVQSCIFNLLLRVGFIKTYSCSHLLPILNNIQYAYNKQLLTSTILHISMLDSVEKGFTSKRHTDRVTHYDRSDQQLTDMNRFRSHRLNNTTNNQY